MTTPTKTAVRHPYAMVVDTHSTNGVVARRVADRAGR